jgi:O-antigen/teichoic acid export membrane protein
MTEPMASAQLDIAQTHIITYSLRQNFSWLLLGNIIYAASQWGILIVLAKMGGVKMVGQFSLAVAFSAPLVIFSNLALRQIQVTDAQRQYPFTDYLSLRIITSTPALLVIIGIAFLYNRSQETSLVIILIGIAKTIESISDILYGFLQQQERMDYIAKSMIIKGLSTLLVMAVMIYMTENLVWAVLALLIVWLIIFIVYDIRVCLAVSGKSLWHNWQMWVSKILIPRKKLIPLLKMSLPLGLVALLVSLNANIPRYLIAHFLGEGDLGIFTGMDYILVASSILMNTLGQAALPRLAIYYTKHNFKAFNQLFMVMLWVGGSVGLAGVGLALLLGKQILTLLYQPAYADHVEVFVLLMGVALVSHIVSFSGYAMTALRHINAQLSISLLSTVILVIAGLILLPTYGLVGAAIAALLSMLARAVASLMIVVGASREKATVL